MLRPLVRSLRLGRAVPPRGKALPPALSAHLQSRHLAIATPIWRGALPHFPAPCAAIALALSREGEMMTRGFPHARFLRHGGLGALCIPPLLLAGCSSLGSAMSPYSETFSCKNGDHGQCVHPEKAYEDASQGIRSRSDPAVTDDKDLLRPHRLPNSRRGMEGALGAYGSYRDSVYREREGLIEAPENPMLRPAQAVRTLILGDTPRRGDPDRQGRDPGGAAVAARPDRARRARLSAC